MKQRIITLIIIMLTFFSIFSVNYQVWNSLTSGSQIQSEAKFSSIQKEKADTKEKENNECNKPVSLSEFSNFEIPVKLVFPF